MNRPTLRNVFPIAALLALGAANADADDRQERFRTSGRTTDEAAVLGTFTRRPPAAEAPTGFDNLTNGYLEQGPAFDTLDEDNVVPLRSFNDNRFIFEEVEVAADGLGPIYNAQSCRECHQNVVTGGASQIAEHRTGRLNGDAFFESLGGSLIQSRATHPGHRRARRLRGRHPHASASRPTRSGAGFVEAIANRTLLAIRDRQPAEMRGTALDGAGARGDGSARIGRFGWKSQHASLESFAADAYLNEMGITSPLFPEENTSSGRFVGFGTRYDAVADPEDDGDDVVAFADFMRATKAPSRGRDHDRRARAALQIFTEIGCADLPRPHRSAPQRPGTVINGGAFHGAGRARQQDHPSLQRLPAARHRHRRRHPVPADGRVRVDREPDPHGAALGAADAQSPDARRPLVHQAGGDRAPRGPGRERDGAISTRCPRGRAESQLLAFLDSL